MSAGSVTLPTGCVPGPATRLGTEVDGVPATAGAAFTASGMPLSVADTAARVIADVTTAEGSVPPPINHTRRPLRRAGQTASARNSTLARTSIALQMTSARPTASGTPGVGPSGRP